MGKSGSSKHHRSHRHHDSHDRRHKHKHPPPPKRNDSHHSRYVNMLLEQDDIPPLYNILAAFFVWLLLAGFLVFPGTFTSIKASIDKTEEDADWDDDDTRAQILKSVRNMPLLVIAAIFCGIAAVGMISLALKHRSNYVWLVNRLLMPGGANSLAGLISTLIGVYTQHGGTWSITAKVTAIVEGVALGICAALFILIERFLLKKVKETHGTHYDKWYGEP